MPEACSASLESGQGARLRAWMEGPETGGVHKQVVRIGEQRQHLLRIGFPIGSGMEETAGSDDPAQHGHELPFEDTPLVVSLLRPGVREQEIDAGQAGRREALFHDLDGIVTADAQVGESAPFDFEQQMSHARTVDLYP